MNGDTIDTLRESKTVGQLIRELKNYCGDAVVVFAHDYGDRHHTTQILRVYDVRALDAGEHISETPYSETGLALESGDAPEDQEGDGETIEVVILV